MAGAGAVVARILTQYSDKGTKAAQKDIARLEKKINAFGKRAVQSFGIATAATAAFAVKVGVDAVKAAIEDQKSQQGLANVLKNVVNATDANIAATEKYISQQQMLTNISDNELRASLAKLVTVTGDVTTAMDLQSVAIDAAAGSGNSLEAVTSAIAKAQAGNFTSLKKLFPALDESIIKNKQLGKALLALDKTYKGTAQQLAKTDPLTSLSIAFGEISEQLGAALLPAVIIFADYVKSDVIPLIEMWITKNEDGLNETLQNSVGKIQEVVEAFKDIYAVLGGINAILPFGIGGWLKLAAAVSAFSTASGLALAALKRYKALKTMAGLARGSTTTFAALRTEMSLVRSIGVKVFQVFGSIGAWAARSTGFIALITRGFIALSRAIMMTPWGRIATIVVALGYGIKKLGDHFGWFGKGQVKLSKSAQAVEDSIKKSAGSYQTMDGALNKYNSTKEKAVALTAEEIARNKRLAALNAKQAQDAAKKAKFDADYAKINARLAKNYGVRLVSGDDDKMIQINAAEALLKRQGKLDEVNASLLKTLKEEVLLMKVKNDLAMRYDDILKALADNKITTQEVQVLALKWGVTTEAVEGYLLQLKIIEDGTISDDEIIKLAKSWGSTQAQAAQYLDFFQALNDGVLSVKEIENLKSKWGLTEQQVRQYADFVGVVNDGKLDDSEVKKLMDKWKLTSDQVVAYILKIGSPVTYSGSLIDPATAATIGWKNAKDALQAYLDLLGKGTTTTSPVNPNTSNLPQPSTGNVGNIDAVNKQVADAAKQLVDEITATGESSVSISKVANDMAAALLKDKAATEALGGTAGVLSSARYTGQALQYAAQQAAAQAAQAKIADSEITAAALRQLTSGGTLTDDQRMRLGMSSTVNTAASISPSSGSGTTNVTVNVQGSVTSQNDLVSAIRQGLLQDQVNGKTLTVSAL